MGRPRKPVNVKKEAGELLFNLCGMLEMLRTGHAEEARHYYNQVASAGAYQLVIVADMLKKES